MLNQEKIKEIQERIEYQKALYRFHDCDDPALKEHFASIIRGYETRHKKPDFKGLPARILPSSERI